MCLKADQNPENRPKLAHQAKPSAFDRCPSLRPSEKAVILSNAKDPLLHSPQPRQICHPERSEGSAFAFAVGLSLLSATKTNAVILSEA